MSCSSIGGRVPAGSATSLPLRLTRSPDSDPGWMEKRHGQMTADGVLQ